MKKKLTTIIAIVATIASSAFGGDWRIVDLKPSDDYWAARGYYRDNTYARPMPGMPGVLVGTVSWKRPSNNTADLRNHPMSNNTSVRREHQKEHTVSADGRFHGTKSSAEALFDAKMAERHGGDGTDRSIRTTAGK
jgi:hypothetical protein